MAKYDAPNPKMKAEQAEKIEQDKMAMLKRDHAVAELKFDDKYPDLETEQKSVRVLSNFLDDVDSNMFMRGRRVDLGDRLSRSVGRWGFGARAGAGMESEYGDEKTNLQRARERRLLQSDDPVVLRMWPKDEVHWSERAQSSYSKPAKGDREIKVEDPLLVDSEYESEVEEPSDRPAMDSHSMLHLSRRRQRYSDKPPAVLRAGRKCPFCNMRKELFEPMNRSLLKQFTSYDGRILPRRVNRTCAKHQRKLARTVKTSRILFVLSRTDVDQGYLMWHPQLSFEAQAPALMKALDISDDSDDAEYEARPGDAGYEELKALDSLPGYKKQEQVKQQGGKYGGKVQGGGQKGGKAAGKSKQYSKKK